MRSLLIAATIAAAAAAPGSANILVNGSFETGDFTGWTQFGNTDFSSVQTVGPTGPGEGPGCEVCAALDGVQGGGAPDGDYIASFGPVESQGGILQSVMTTAGASYTLSFVLRNEGGVPNFFSVSFGDTVLESMTDAPQSDYQTYSYTLTGTGTANDLTFTFRDDPSYWDLDAVSLDADSTDVPEPAMLGLFGLGAVGLGLARRRRA